VRALRGSGADRPGGFSMPNGRSVAVAAMSLRMCLHHAHVRAHLRREALAALDVVGELVEARAGGRQHDGVARPGEASRPAPPPRRACPAFPPAPAAPASARSIRAASRRSAAPRDSGRRRAAGAARSPAPCRRRRRSARRAAEALGARPSSPDRRALGIVDVQHAARFPDPLHPVRQAFEAGQRCQHRVARSSPPRTRAPAPASAF